MKRMARTTILLWLASVVLVAALPTAAQRRACPRIPSVTNDPLNRSYRAGDTVPAELLDPPFAWSQCDPPSPPAGATRSAQPRVVFLSVSVDETGAVIDARPRGAIDPEGYYDAAVATIRSWRTNKPQWRGLPVKASIAVDVNFARAESAAAEPSAVAAQPITPLPAPTIPAEPQAPATPAPTQPAPEQAVATQQPPISPAVAPPAPAPQRLNSTPAPQSIVTPAQAPALAPTQQPATPTPQPAPLVAVPAPEPAPTPAAIDPLPARAEVRSAPPPMRSQARATGEPFVVEYYYKVKWGFADEFWQLFNRNHWLLLQKQIEMGRILEVRAARPRYHATEDGRWDYRVTIVFRSAAEANAPFDTEALERQLFPDLEGYRREERRRFELLLAHWDVPVLPAGLEP